MNTKYWLFIRHRSYPLVAGSPRGITVNQQGAILPLVAIGLGALLAMTGLALDMGHLYLNRTRLQNAVDAAAMSGAKTLNELGNNAAAQSAATTDARTAFQNNATASGNSDLLNIANTNVNVQFSATLNPFVAGGANPRYIRVAVAAANFTWPTWLIRILGAGFANSSVGGSAVAGPMSVCPNNILPMIACTDDAHAGSPPNFGYVVGNDYTLKVPAGNNSNSPVGPGNFQLLSLNCGNGANCVRDNLAGAFNNGLCTGTNSTAVTQPGNLDGPTKQGLNSRLDCPGGCGPVDTSMYPPDIYTDIPITYNQYQTALADPSTAFNPRGVPGRRILTVPFANCTGIAQGRSDITILGLGCFFMTDKVQQGGNNNSVNSEYVSACPSSGGSLSYSNSQIGPWTIILYKDYTLGVSDS
ncbi:MAG TPA: pilus assembly protein TadG-related protein [Methylobacter sp.]|jgi:Flp pilus assembly protein TadG